MDLHIDRQRATDLARDLGITISFDNPRPGVIINTPQGAERYSFFDLFPELQPVRNHFVMVEECVLATFTSDIDLAKTSVALVHGNNDFSDPILLIRAA